MEEYDKIENLIFKSPIVQTLLSEVGKSEEYDVNIGIPIKKQFEDNGKLIIAGYASVEIIDTQKELIPLEVLKEAWDKFSENEDFMIGTLMHSNIPVIKILKDYKDSKGEVWKSGVDDTGLFIVAQVNDSIEKGKQARELIEKGALAGFSIGGEALASSVHCEGKCYTRIDKMELHEIAVVDKPANKASVFTIVKRLKKENGIPKDDVQRAKDHFEIPDQVWDDMTEEDRQRFIDKLPERGSKKEVNKALSLEDFKHMTIKQMISKLKKWEKERKDIGYKSPPITKEEIKYIELTSNINSIKHAIGERMLLEKMIDSSKLDKALEFIEKRLIGKPFAGYKDFADCVAQNKDKGNPKAYCGAIQAQVEKLNKQQEKPPKAQWDRCEDKARGIASIDDPAAFCGNLWYNDKPKWNAFIKGEIKKCGCPVDKTITAKSIKKLKDGLSKFKLIVETQKKKPNKKVNK